MTYSLQHLRRSGVRNSLRVLARTLLPAFARINLSGLEKFPANGPLIVVGNHTGAMEVVLMGAFSTRPLEFMGSVEMPWNGWIETVVNLYGMIPVHRGSTRPKTMKMALDVLHQGGMLGVFPEGGFWEPGMQKAQTGVAWLSSIARAPILPIGFGDTRGKMSQLFQLKQPTFDMNIGDLLPAVNLDSSTNKKQALQQAADDIMNAVWALVPEEERLRRAGFSENERFEFDLKVFDRTGQPVPIPPQLALSDGSWISRFAHRPNLIDSIRDYIFIPVQVLKELHKNPPPQAIHQAAHSMLEYVEHQNPQYFNYRYGYRDGQAFHHSFRQLRDLMQWVVENDHHVQAEARYEFLDPQTGQKRILRTPEEVAQW